MVPGTPGPPKIPKSMDVLSIHSIKCSHIENDVFTCTYNHTESHTSYTILPYTLNSL